MTVPLTVYGSKCIEFKLFFKKQLDVKLGIHKCRFIEGLLRFKLGHALCSTVHKYCVAQYNKQIFQYINQRHYKINLQGRLKVALRLDS